MSEQSATICCIFQGSIVIIIPRGKILFSDVRVLLFSLVCSPDWLGWRGLHWCISMLLDIWRACVYQHRGKALPCSSDTWHACAQHLQKQECSELQPQKASCLSQRSSKKGGTPHPCQPSNKGATQPRKCKHANTTTSEMVGLTQDTPNAPSVGFDV